MDDASRYPLTWPTGYTRTPARRRTRSRFGGQRSWTIATATQSLMDEAHRMRGARGFVLSTNIELRRDGLPYSNRRAPEDPGAAFYFQLNGEPICVACDAWDRVPDNIRAIAKTLDAMRGLERWGCSDMMKRAYTGFKALPSGGDVNRWWEILEVDRDADHSTVKRAFFAMARKYHPDQNADPAAPAMFDRVQKAFAAYNEHTGRLALGAGA